MTCKKCGSEIVDGPIACIHCVRVAQVLHDREVRKREDSRWFTRYHDRDEETLWVAAVPQEDGSDVYHFSMVAWIDYCTVSFCGMDLDHKSGTQARLDLSSPDNFCPLCYDRLMQRGGGICGDVCTGCGGVGDDGHKDGCILKMPAPGEILVIEKPEGRLLSDDIRGWMGR